MTTAKEMNESLPCPFCYVVLDADGHTAGTAPHITLDGALADAAAEQRERPFGAAPEVLYCYRRPATIHPSGGRDVLLSAANLLREASTEYERSGGGATPFGTRLLEGAESLDALRHRWL